MSEISIVTDVEYAAATDERLTLDIYRPDTVPHAPTVIYLHGGGWDTGDKADGANGRLIPLAQTGVAVVSINYRLAPRARYPLQVHDVKAAVRWLRARGIDHGLSTEYLGIWGASAGGYLATIVGLTSNNRFLEGNLGTHTDHSSTVQAVVSWFAPTDLLNSAHRTPLESRVLHHRPSVTTLFGRSSFETHDTEVRSASPLDNVHPDAPPFLIAHGNLDRIVPESNSHDLFNTLARRRIDVTYCMVGGAGHEDPQFDSQSNLAITAAWLKSQLSTESH